MFISSEDARAFLFAEGLAEHADDLLGCLLRRLTVTPAPTDRVGGTRIGGTPDVPPGLEWPVRPVPPAPVKAASLASISDPNSGLSDRVEYHMYVVTAWNGGEPNMVGDEHIELAWFMPQRAIELRDLALNEYRALLKMLADS